MEEHKEYNMPFVFIDIPAPEKRYQGYEFDKRMFDCDGLHKNMPVHQFLDVLSRDHNMKVFLLEQARGRTSVDSRRRTIWSIVVMMRMIYPTVMSSEWPPAILSYDQIHFSLTDIILHS